MIKKIFTSSVIIYIAIIFFYMALRYVIHGTMSISKTKLIITPLIALLLAIYYAYTDKK
jgi:hypothetical protein